ncbi:MAG: hypothetical protein GY820_45370, partial [Gammaproteobacteria bacterium]|nr:hypothetical protein [Gammaproteobacteria bacterium]
MSLAESLKEFRAINYATPRVFARVGIFAKFLFHGMQNNLNFIMALSDFRYDQPITDGERFFGESAIFRF